MRRAVHKSFFSGWSYALRSAWVPYAWRKVSVDTWWGPVMPILRTILLTVMALAGANAVGKPAAQKSAPPAALSVTLNQGEVARWPGIAARSCVLGARKYPAVDAICYYPF